MIRPNGGDDIQRRFQLGLKALENRSKSREVTDKTGAEGEYDPKTGVVSFKTAPASIASILNNSSILNILNIPPNTRVGFKLEGKKPVATNEQLIDARYLQGIRALLSDMNLDADKTNIMSAFITHNGRDIYVASVLIPPNNKNILCSNREFNSIHDRLFPLMENASKICAQFPFSALRLKQPDIQQEELYFYKLNDLGQKYQPLIDYMDRVQTTHPETDQDAYLVIDEFLAKELPSHVRTMIETNEKQSSGQAITTDQTIITSVSLSGDTNKQEAPVLIFTNTDTPVALIETKFRDFFRKQKGTTQKQAVDLALSLFNEYAAAN
jgi:hypothetical protein